MRRRGSILVALSGGMVVLLLAFTFAAIALADWNFSLKYASGVSDELVARAVIQQFLSDDKRLRRTDLCTPPNVPHPVDWLRRFRDAPVFPDGGEQLPGRAELTFDPAKAYFSVDNTLGATPVSGWVDRSSSSQSVPPHSVSLIIGVRSGGRLSHYQALLQCLWPYALTSAGPIRIGGGLHIPSHLSGAVLLLPESLASLVPVPLDGNLQQNDVMPVSDTMYDSLRSTANSDPTPLRLGFTFPEADLGDNSMEGQVDSVAGEPVTLTPSLNPNSWQGRARAGYADLRQRQALGRLFAYPPAPSGCDLPAAAYTQISSEPNRYLLTQNLELSGDPDQDITYQVDGSLSNLDAQGNSSNAGISLRNCRLYINGNLDLGQGGLQGDNATLIVNGHIVLREGNMEAADKGLVIMCNRLGVSAEGCYRGLILVRDCCAFAKMHIANSQHPQFLTPLEIRGAIICGGGSAQMRLASQPDSNQSTVIIRGVSLASARFLYDPRYLTWLQPISPYRLVHLERLD